MTEAHTTTRTLVLLRHAKAEHHARVSDEMRALTPGGRRQAHGVGDALAAAGLQPDRVLCSTSVRTRQTYELVSSGLGVRPDVEFLEELYDSGVSGSLDVIGGTPPGAATLLVVGHEPVMSGIAYVLAGPGSDESALARVRAGVPTGAYVVVRLSVPWDALSRGVGVLTDVVTSPHHA